MSERARGPCARGAVCTGQQRRGRCEGVVRASTAGGSEASRDQEKPPEGLSWGETGSDCCSQGFCRLLYFKAAGPRAACWDPEGKMGRTRTQPCDSGGSTVMEARGKDREDAEVPPSRGLVKWGPPQCSDASGNRAETWGGHGCLFPSLTGGQTPLFTSILVPPRSE